MQQGGDILSTDREILEHLVDRDGLGHSRRGRILPEASGRALHALDHVRVGLPHVMAQRVVEVNRGRERTDRLTGEGCA